MQKLFCVTLLVLVCMTTACKTSPMPNGVPAAVPDTDAGLKAFVEENKGVGVRVMSLGANKITDNGLKELRKVKGLKFLWLESNKITDDGLKELKDIKSLEFLGIRSDKITDAGVKEIKGLKSLQTLKFLSDKITDAGMKDIAEIKSLTYLDIRSPRITDAGLRELKKLENLRTLNLQSDKITVDGLKELKEALPGVLVTVQQPKAWGPTIAGCRLSVSTNQHIYKVGEPITLQTTLDNVGDNAVQTLSSEVFVEGVFVENHFVVRRSDRTDAPLTGEGIRLRDRSNLMRAWIELDPGDSNDREVSNINNLYDMTLPSEYDIRVYRSIKLPGDNAQWIEVPSNTIKIVVSKKEVEKAP